MRKEVILAIIVGILLGGVILYGLNLANTSVKPEAKTTDKPSSSNQDQLSAQQTSDSISITYPTANAVITEASVTLKGTTAPGQNVAIITENDDILTVSDTSGNFSSPITLTEGENLLTVTAIDTQLATHSASVTVIHTDNLPQ